MLATGPRLPLRRSIVFSRDELAASRGVRLYEHAKRLIPGGTQLLSKRPEMFAPGIWPAYYSRAKGCRIWDLDDREFLDMSIMGVGACVLGYADDDVDAAVIDALRSGVASTLNCPEEVELAEELLALHPWFDMVRYARSGGEAMAIAVRIARAHTGKDVVLFSGYHGWSDWYLSANLADHRALDGQLMPGLSPRGVPRGLSGTAIPFSLDDPESLAEQVRGREAEIAAIVVEPARGHDAPESSLLHVREVADEIGAVLIFDEITSGFRMCAGGIHRKYECRPDIAVFAKSMANGYAMAAVLGTEACMEEAQGTFVSSTNWTERIGPVAALATIRKHVETRAHDWLIESGERVKEIWRQASSASALPIQVSGLPSLPSFSFDHSLSKALATNYTTMMLSQGVLGFRQFRPSLAHDADDLAHYEECVKNVFEELATFSEDKLARTSLAHDGFHRLTRE